MIYKKTDSYELYHGQMQDELSSFEENSIDSIITDPPYELNFMNKGWDNAGVSFQKETWEKCLRVLKPGGHLLAFGGSRTYHRIACAIEDAGFEIRDTIMWIYGSGFPKSMDISKSLDKRNGRNDKEFKELGNYLKEKITDTDSICAEKIGFSSALVRFWKLGERIPNKETWIKLKNIYNLDNTFDWLIDREEAEREVIGTKKSLALPINDQLKGWGETREYNITIPSTDLAKQWDGWGTALKPSYEPIIVARKPFKGSLVDNIIEYGVGGINIDECRVPLESTYEYKETNRKPRSEDTVFDNNHSGFKSENNLTASANPLGRFPANTILTYDETDFDEVCGGFPDTKSDIRNPSGGTILNPESGWNNNSMIDKTIRGFNDSGSASRYFYCAKASKKDRDEGLDNFNAKYMAYSNQAQAELKRGNTEFDGDKFNKVQVIKNIHPTVKPTSLMQYLIRLVSPKGATILDPFMGSGSTGKAVMFENRERNADYKFIGIEMTEDYLPICEARINYAMTYVYNDDVKQISNETVTVVKQEKVGLW